MRKVYNRRQHITETPQRKCVICGMPQAIYKFCIYRKQPTLLCKLCAKKLTHEECLALYENYSLAKRYRQPEIQSNWRIIPGYSLYEVNPDGIVRIVNTNKRIREIHGHINLIADQKQKVTQKVHTGVALLGGNPQFKDKEVLQCVVTAFTIKELQDIWKGGEKNGK